MFLAFNSLGKPDSAKKDARDDVNDDVENIGNENERGPSQRSENDPRPGLENRGEPVSEREEDAQGPTRHRHRGGFGIVGVGASKRTRRKNGMRGDTVE